MGMYVMNYVYLVEVKDTFVDIFGHELNERLAFLILIANSFFVYFRIAYLRLLNLVKCTGNKISAVDMQSATGTDLSQVK